MILTPTTIPTRKPPKPQTPKTHPFAPSPQLASTPPTRVEAPVRLGSARNTKIKTENLSSSSTVKIEDSDGTKDGGAQGTGPADPTAPGGSSIEGSNDEEDEQVEASINSDDDLESISARGGGADSDSDDDSDEEAPEAANAEDSDEDNSSIRTSPQLASTPPTRVEARNTKIKTENLSSYATVKIENSDCTKDGGAQGTGPAGPTAPAWSSVPGIVVKEDATKIFTENIQTSGAYSAREESLKREYRAVDMHRRRQIHYDETG